MNFLRRLGKQDHSNEGTPVSAAPASSEPNATPAPRREPITVHEVEPTSLYEKLQAGDDVVFLDVRQSWDHAAQHPAGSLSLPLTELADRLEELDPNKHYVLSCYHGYSSQDGVAFLLNQGFENVESMRGGFSGWAQAGLPVEGQHAS